MRLQHLVHLRRQVRLRQQLAPARLGGGDVTGLRRGHAGIPQRFAVVGGNGQGPLEQLQRRALQIAVAGKGQGLALPGQPLRIGLGSARIGFAVGLGGVGEFLRDEVGAAEHGPALRIVRLLLQALLQLLHHGGNLVFFRRAGSKLLLRLPAAAEAVPTAGKSQQQNAGQQRRQPAAPAAHLHRGVFHLGFAEQARIQLGFQCRCVFRRDQPGFALDLQLGQAGAVGRDIGATAPQRHADGALPPGARHYGRGGDEQRRHQEPLRHGASSRIFLSAA